MPVHSIVPEVPHSRAAPECQVASQEQIRPGNVSITEEPPRAAVLRSDAVSDEALDMFLAFVSRLPSLFAQGTLSEADIAERLGLEKSQAKAWLKRACDEGTVQKLSKPVRYGLGGQRALC